MAIGVLALMFGIGVAKPAVEPAIATDTAAEIATDSISVVGVFPDTGISRWIRFPTDTPHTRPRVIEVSDWYSRRLTIHRWVAYGTVPVFAVQWYAGKQLYDKSRAAPTWAKTTHRVGATMLAGMFTVNTVTGAWNWWDSRAVSKGRVFRTMHALSMLAADAAFSYTGAQLANEAETSSSKRRLHRTVALYSMGLTVLSGTAMKLWNK